MHPADPSSKRSCTGCWGGNTASIPRTNGPWACGTSSKTRRRPLPSGSASRSSWGWWGPSRCSSRAWAWRTSYVVVKERTQEIGIKRALGARRRHIMAQFLFEAMAIALSGGLVGLVVAALIVFGVDAIPTEGNEAMQYILNPRLSWPIALICVGILIGMGLLAGILPARRAAAVDPVESLRYE